MSHRKRDPLPGRTFERGQGCWNCKHARESKPLWLERRASYLTKAVAVAQAHPQGESCEQVISIRRMIDLTDQGVAQNLWVTCKIGKKPDGSSVGDFVHSSYLCSRWSARQGASLARLDSGADKLPEELREELDGPEPTTITRLARMLETKKGEA